MKELCAYWLEQFDWRAQEAALNSLPQFTAPVGDISIHFIHEKGRGPTPLPLIISHGWPGSVFEFLQIIEPLAHPERFGGSEDDAFDVVAPALPGFGFSGKPKRPMGPRRMAGLFAELMTGVHGYDGYLAQGGDWGGAISSWLGYEHAPACRGIHINIMTMRHPGGLQGAEEEAWAVRFEQEQEPSLSHGRPRLGCRLGAFSPSRRQIRWTRLALIRQPSAARHRRDGIEPWQDMHPSLISL